MKRNIVAAFAGAVGLVACLLYVLRADFWTAVTIAPAWLWLPFGALAFCGRTAKLRWLMLLPWLIFLIFCVEEPRSLLRALLPAPDTKGRQVLRMATANVSGNANALRSVLQSGADVICIQESPSPAIMASIVADFKGYTFVVGLDASVIVRGQITLLEKKRRHVLVRATVADRSIVVCSLRLATTPPRFELWSLDVWKSQMSVREQQREEISEVRAALPADTQIIVAGDFNVPQGDPIPKLLGKDFTDAFGGAGRGWCNTILSDLPLLRIDQIWSRGLRFIELRAKVVPETDHRTVLATFF